MEEQLKRGFEESFAAIFAETGLEDLVLKPGPGGIAGADYLCFVGVAGDLRGYLMLSLDDAGFQGLSNRLLSGFSGADSSHDESLRRSAVAEFANQLGGRSAMILGRMGMDCSITPPTFIRGSGMEAAITGLDDRSGWKASGDGMAFGIVVLSKKTAISPKTC